MIKSYCFHISNKAYSLKHAASQIRPEAVCQCQIDKVYSEELHVGPSNTDRREQNH